MKTIFTVLYIWRGIVEEVRSYETEEGAEAYALELLHKHTGFTFSSYEEIEEGQEVLLNEGHELLVKKSLFVGGV